jgi:hypothetical protein
MGHKSSWGVDNRGNKAVSEVLLHKDGTSKVHGVLADGTKIAYELTPGGGGGGDKFVGRQLSDGYWVKARTVNAVPEYILCRGEGFKLTVIFQCTDSGVFRLLCCLRVQSVRGCVRLREISLSTHIYPRRHMLVYLPVSHFSIMNLIIPSTNQLSRRKEWEMNALMDWHFMPVEEMGSRERSEKLKEAKRLFEEGLLDGADYKKEKEAILDKYR